MTADNEFTSWINGRTSGQRRYAYRTFTFDIAGLLKQGENLMAVEAVNTTDAPSPAGLIGALISNTRTAMQTIFTDKTWKSAEKCGRRWLSGATPAKDGTRPRSLVLSAWPPGAIWKLRASNNDLYPEADLVTGVLKKMDVPPDFTYQNQEPAKSLRYIHRKRTAWTSISSPTNYRARAGPVRVPRFGKRPELWWPETGGSSGRPSTKKPTAGPRADRLRRGWARCS